jgi:hypothetical protein
VTYVNDICLPQHDLYSHKMQYFFVSYRRPGIIIWLAVGRVLWVQVTVYTRTMLRGTAFDCNISVLKVCLCTSIGLSANDLTKRYNYEGQKEVVQKAHCDKGAGSNRFLSKLWAERLESAHGQAPPSLDRVCAFSSGRKACGQCPRRYRK